MALEEVFAFRRATEKLDKAGAFVVHDRHILDRKANAVVAGCPMQEIEEILLLIPPPKITFLLDLPIEVADARMLASRGKLGLDETKEEQQRNRRAYLEIATNDPSVRVLDANAPADAVFEEAKWVLKAVFPMITERRQVAISVPNYALRERVMSVLNKFDEHSGQIVHVMGRITSCRKMSRFIFLDLWDENNKIQLLIKRSIHERWPRPGDLVWVSGKCLRTNTGDPSIEVHNWLPLAHWQASVDYHAIHFGGGPKLLATFRPESYKRLNIAYSIRRYSREFLQHLESS